jgi:hypothetical protein
MEIMSSFSAQWVIIRSVFSLDRVIIWVIIMTWLRSLLFFCAVVTLVHTLVINNLEAITGYFWQKVLGLLEDTYNDIY